jgi:hypothetical protein
MTSLARSDSKVVATRPLLVGISETGRTASRGLVMA